MHATLLPASLEIFSLADAARRHFDTRHAAYAAITLDAAAAMSSRCHADAAIDFAFYRYARQDAGCRHADTLLLLIRYFRYDITLDIYHYFRH